MRKLRNHSARPLLLGLFLAACLLASAQAGAQQLRIAAAADLQFAMKDLAVRYEALSGLSLSISYGSSGNFFAQIENGAPFDLFFSADSSYPRGLIEARLAERATLYPYALGRLVLWAPVESPLAIPEKGFAVLLDPRIQKIAIANPEHAPYGRAAVMALQKVGIYEQVKAKLVFGENISQAAQFVQSGAAQVGIVALSLAASSPMNTGKRWLIPAELYPPLEQAAVVIRASRNKPAAIAFLDFVKSGEGRDILARYGFTPAQPSAGEAKP